MNESTPGLVPIFRLELTFSETFAYASTTGPRLGIVIGAGTATGPRLTGTVADDGGELIVVRPDGTLDLDSRMMLRLDDGRFVYWRAKGSVLLSPDQAEAAGTGTLPEAPVVVSPYFDVPDDDDLRWLTRAAFVGRGTYSAKGAMIDIYMLEAL